MTAAKTLIPSGQRNNVLCWDDEFKNLCNAFLQAQQGTETNKKATVLLTRLDAKQKKRWLKTVYFIDFERTPAARRGITSIKSLAGEVTPIGTGPFQLTHFASQLVMNGRVR